MDAYPLADSCLKKASIDLDPLKKIVKTEIIPHVKTRDEREEFPIDLFKKLHETQWLHAFIPQELGGQGLPTTDLIWIAREIAYGSAGNMVSIAGNTLALVPVARGGEDALRAQVSSEILSNLSLSSFCFTEPDTGSDVFRIKTKATKDGKFYRITGKKCFVTNASFADRFLVAAQVENPSSTSSGDKIQLFLVPRSSAGLSVGKPYSKMGLRDSNTGEIFMDHVMVPESNRIEGVGTETAFLSIQKSRTLLAATAVGLCQRASDITIDYLSNRCLYGKALLTQPSIRNLLAQLHTEMQAAWYLTCFSASQWDHGVFSFQASSMAKLYAGQTAVKFLGACLELFGGWGCTREFEIERLYRDAKFFEILEGPTFVQQTILAKELFPNLKREGDSKQESNLAA